jgi:hypothetical protein
VASINEEAFIINEAVNKRVDYEDCIWGIGDREDRVIKEVRNYLVVDPKIIFNYSWVGFIEKRSYFL